MGGFFRAVTRIFRQPPQVVQQQAPVATTPVSQTTTNRSRQTLASSGQDSANILTSSQGIEEEANVSKTILGGTIQKKSKKV